jgi:hypothetical protein
LPYGSSRANPRPAMSPLIGMNRISLDASISKSAFDRSMEHGALANTAARLLLLADSDLPAMFAFAPLSAIVDVPIVG